MHGQQVGVPSENHHSSPTRKICSKPNIPLMNCIIWEHLGVGRELWDIPMFPHNSKSAVSPVIALEVVSIFAIRLRKPFLFSETPFRTPDLIIAASILSSESLLDVAEFFDLSDRVQATKNDRSFLFIPIARTLSYYRNLLIRGSPFIMFSTWTWWPMAAEHPKKEGGSRRHPTGQLATVQRCRMPETPTTFWIMEHVTKMLQNTLLKLKLSTSMTEIPLGFTFLTRWAVLGGLNRLRWGTSDQLLWLVKISCVKQCSIMDSANPSEFANPHPWNPLGSRS